MVDQKPFGEDVQFAENPEPRCPCVLLLDISESMTGAPISELNSGLVAYKDELAADALAMKRVELAVVTFGGEINVASDFTTGDLFSPPMLSPNGDTPMGQAITKAIDMVTERKAVYKANGIAYYRPWIFMITDGAPTDTWKLAAQKVHEGEASKSFSFYCVGVEGANFEVLKQISVREPLALQGLRFRDLFVWLSASQKKVSQSKVGDKIALPPPTWAQAEI